MQVSLTALNAVKEMKDYIDQTVVGSDPAAIYEDCMRDVQAKAADLARKMQEMTERDMDRKDYDQFNLFQSNLIALKTHVPALREFIDKELYQIDKKLLDKALALRSSVQTVQGKFPIEQLAKCLIRMKSLANNIYSLKERIDAEINRLLDEYREQPGGAAKFIKLVPLLSKDPSGAGKNIMAEHPHFEGCIVSLFNLKTQRQGISYVLDRLTKDSGQIIDVEKLASRYREFDEEYKSLVKTHLAPEVNYKRLVAETMLHVGHTDANAS